jgi:hypothetical protein
VILILPVDVLISQRGAEEFEVGTETLPVEEFAMKFFSDKSEPLTLPVLVLI